MSALVMSCIIAFACGLLESALIHGFHDIHYFLIRYPPPQGSPLHQVWSKDAKRI